MKQEEQRDKVKILFVDDEANILQAVRRLFMDEPFDILTASSGQEGLEVLHSEPGINLIVSDQRMPGMTGVEFLQQAEKIRPHALRIVLTGYDDVQVAADAIHKGAAFLHLEKPWNNDVLIQTIKEAVLRLPRQETKDKTDRQGF